MNALKKKLGKNGGFTLVEMLIVVAIIAILIAISIPMFSAALEKTRHAVDDANMRDAISMANIEYLTNQDKYDGSGTDKTFYYQVDESVEDNGGTNAHRGELVDSEDDENYDEDKVVTSKCTGSGADDCSADRVGALLKVTIAKNGDITATWEKAGS